MKLFSFTTWHSCNRRYISCFLVVALIHTETLLRFDEISRYYLRHLYANKFHFYQAPVFHFFLENITGNVSRISFKNFVAEFLEFQHICSLLLTLTGWALFKIITVRCSLKLLCLYFLQYLWKNYRPKQQVRKKTTYMYTILLQSMLLFCLWFEWLYIRWGIYWTKNIFIWTLLVIPNFFVFYWYMSQWNKSWMLQATGSPWWCRMIMFCINNISHSS